MDVWQIVNLTLPFLEVILHTIIDNLKQKGPNISIVKPLHQSKIYSDGKYRNAEKMVRNVATFGLTILYGLFIVGFFCAGLLWN